MKSFQVLAGEAPESTIALRQLVAKSREQLAE